MNAPNSKQPLPTTLKILVGAAALPLLGFCIFGFLATFEPNPTCVTWPFRIGYALTGLAIMFFAGRLIFRKNNRPAPK